MLKSLELKLLKYSVRNSPPYPPYARMRARGALGGALSPRAALTGGGMP